VAGAVLRSSVLQIRVLPHIDSIVLGRMSGLVIYNILVCPRSSSNVTFHESPLRLTWGVLKKRIWCARWWHASEWLPSVGELRISSAQCWPVSACDPLALSNANHSTV
jgi:hypothetical protein